MGLTCRVCGKERPHEAFSGRGHRIQVCKTCQPVTKTDEWKAAQVQNEIWGYLNQKNISRKNQERLKTLCESTNPTVAEQARLVLEVARIKSHKVRRFSLLREKHPELITRLRNACLLFPEGEDESPEEDNATFDDFGVNPHEIEAEYPFQEDYP